MFGYLSPERSRLSSSEYRDYFKGYCGLCEQLKKDYGRWGRFFVSRDAVMLLLLSEAQVKAEPACCEIRCGVNWRLHDVRAEPGPARYAAAVTVMLLIGRLMDAVREK